MRYFLLTIAAASIFSGCAGTPPTDIGDVNGNLAPCPDSPNCVSSQASVADERHFIEPLRYESDRASALATLTEVLEETPRIKIVLSNDRYIRAEARTRIMRFVDDLEFYFHENEKIIHLRSASRLGESDLGENRKRIEMIRTRFYAELSAATES